MTDCFDGIRRRLSADGVTAARSLIFGPANEPIPIGSVCLDLVVAMPLASVRLKDEQ